MNLLPPPGPARWRQLGLLAIVVVVGSILLWRQYGGASPAETPKPASNSQAAPVAVGGGSKPTMPQPLALGALEPVPDQPVSGRNPFRFGVPPAPPRPAYVPPPVVTGPPPPPPGPPPPPPIPLKFKGRAVWTDGRPIAILVDDQGGEFRAFEGDIVDGRYRVVKIGLESVVVSYLDGSGQRTLAYGG